MFHLENALKAYVDPLVYCDRELYWIEALRGDGSRDMEYRRRKELVRRAVAEFRDQKRYLTYGDEQAIAAYMTDIDAIVREQGRTAVFVIPPVYQKPQVTVVDQVFDRALELAPNLNVVDHRNLDAPTEYFADYDHPSPLYFENLIAELRRRSLLR